MKPILIQTNQKYSNELISNGQVHLGDLNEILNEYNSLNLSPLSGEDFKKLIHNPKSVIFDKINAGQSLTFNGMQINRDKAMDFVTMPNGFNELNSLIESYKNTRVQWSPFLIHTDIMDGQVVIKQSAIDAHIKMGELYITTEKEKNLYDFLETVIKAANENFGKSKQDLGHLITNLITIDTDPATSKNYKINYRAVKGFGSPQ